MLVYFLAVFLCVFALAVFISPFVLLAILNKKIRKFQEEQAKFFDELYASLGKRGFKADRIAKIQMPSKRFFLYPKWIPAVYCFLCVDSKHKKWTISYNQRLEPKIYDFEDFNNADIDVNGKPAGNAGLNALIGAAVGGGLGAGFGPAWTNPDGSVVGLYTPGGSLIGTALGAAIGLALTRRYGVIKSIDLKLRMNNPDDRFITIPILNAPLKGIRDDKGLERVMDFVAQLNDTFQYINSHS
jgi:hypothetical protein